MKGLTSSVMLILLTAIDLGVPYLMIGHIPSIWATYLFWTLLTLGVILFAIVYTSQWGRQE